MRKINFKSIWQTVVIATALAGLLLCLNGCKQPIDSGNTTTNAPTGTTAPQNSTTPSEDTNPTTKPTTPTVDTNPTDVTTPTDETPPIDCVHELGNWIVEKASTCTTEGVRYKECGLCKYKIETEVIPIVPHSASSWIIDQKATCTTEGLQHQECAQCKKLLASIVVSKADHKGYAIRGYEATPSTPGLTQGYFCTSCGTTAQEQFTIPPLNQLGITYQINADRKSCTITGFSNRNTDALILPDAIDGYTVTAIKANAFSGCTALKTVYLPDSVTTIGAQAFRGCSKLTNITFEGTTIQWISVIKGTNWDANTGNFKIYCKNNYIAK